MASHRMTNEELDEQFEQFLKESFSDESGDVGGSAKRTSVLDSLGKTSSQRPAKKAAISSRPWWQDEDYDDNAGGTGRGSSRRSFQKSSRKSQPIREEEEEEFLGQMAFSDEERQQGVPSRVRQEPEDSMLASGPDLTPGGPGLETLEEEEEKARFFARLEAGASSTLDYSRLNRDLDSPRSTPAQSLRKPEEAGEGSEEDEKPATEGISQACADSPDYSDNFEEDEKEKEPAETMPPISSLDAKGSLYDSLDSNDRRAPSMQLRGKDPAFSSDKGQSYGQSCGSEMEALQEAYRQISDAPGVPEDRVDGRRSRPSTSASPLEQSRGDLLPASTNGSELPTAEELMRPIRPETSDYIRGFPLKPSSRSGTGLDLRPGSAEPRHAGVKSGPVAEPWRERGSSGSLSPDTPLRRQPLSIREEVERLMEDQDREHHQSPIPSTQASRAKQKPRGGPAGRPSLSSTRKSTVTSALRGSKAKEDGHSAMACRFSRPNRPTVKGKASPPPTQRKPVARVQHSPPPIKGIPENAGLQVSGDLVASVQSFAAFLQQQVGPAGPQVATATWDVNARRDVATGVKGLSDSNVEEGSMVQGLAHKEIDHLSHKQIDHPSQKERDLAQRERDLAQRERDLAQKERDLHLRLEEVEMQHREDLGAVKQENYVLQSKLRKAESSQGGQRWGEAADPMTMDRLQLLEKEVQQQETIIQGYHKENEKLCWEMKAQQTRSRATEEAMFAENQRLLNELRLAKEQLKNMPGTPLNACPMEHTQRITELLTHMEVIQKGEAKWSEESRSLRQQKQALEVDLQLMKKERDLLKAQVLSSSGDPGAVLGVRGDGHREEVAALQKKLHWYAENQQLLDRDAARLRAASDETRQLKEQLENLKIEVRKSSSQQHTKAKEKTGDAKKIQALERQVKVMEDLLRRRQPNSLPALIYAAASASGPGGEDPTTTATPTLVTGLLERKVERLEAELDGHKEEAKRGLRAMEQQFQRIKLSYEQQISELEQKLVQRQNPEGAAPPPCPPSGGGEQQGVTEAQRSVELALQEQIQSLQQQLSRKAPPPEPERAPPPEPERARRSPSRHQVQSEAAFGARIERLTQELAAKTRSVQELSRTVERLQRERKGLLSGSWSREARPANANAAARPRAAASGDARVGGAGVGGGGDEAGAGEEEERFPAAQYEKTYRPDAFAGSHITEVLEENQALREQLGRLEERPDAGEPHGALAHAREELCRLKESTAEQLSSLVAHQRLEMDQLRAGHAQDHSSSRVAQLSNRLNTQEIVVQHLKEQLKDFKATKDTLAVSKIREETLQTQLTRLLEELRQAREAHSPELRHLHGLEAKICSMELRHTQREDQLKQLICQTRQVVESEQHSEVERWKGLAQGRSREVEAFRLELDSILDVLRELRRQGVVFPSPESHLHTPFTWKS
ncbi:centrosomal protein of 162 kDa isoform X3 [Gadus chalcogrammus]|uniref:centrosomal protein of 162 kDa isoform X3 n=1 Tax=Gadus chalcogrammus TaxID=1042646 RepID=UPI0024C47E2E|nr:centrosomal protein of 162 kDa isoform X3 [Gadus chalcogrammus]